jgi:hypothetical protein
MAVRDKSWIFFVMLDVRLVIGARIHSQFESLGFVGKYDQSPTKLVNS